jgi:hypothetical protein
MSERPQSFQNHTKFVPFFHFVVLPILGANFFWAGWRLIQAPGIERALSTLIAFAIAFGVVFGRVFALQAQDRVIRLEMRIRLASLLPEALRARIPELTVGQMVALRFASDAELPQLVATVLKDNIRDKTAIKKMITQWTPDHARL